MFGKPKPPPNTISDKDWKSIKDRANDEQMRTGGMFTPKAISQRLASNRQHDRARES